MNIRVGVQSYWNNSFAVRQEIQRFESVHPSIYAIYDLIEAIPDFLLQQQIREHVVCIEDSFVNSQEWTLNRSVPDLKLGILGSVQSGKSALVHRYLTGSYLQEESPEGGRFKKEVILDGQSYLLLIRDEGGSDEGGSFDLQFAHWVDAVILVFSLENEASFQAIYNHYARLSQHRDIKEIPLILVGTQDSISESNPRIIDDIRARKLASDLRRCSYYETCATYGLNVERVFQDACSRIIQYRYHAASAVPATFPSTPHHSHRPFVPTQVSSVRPADAHSNSSQSTSSSGATAACLIHGRGDKVISDMIRDAGGCVNSGMAVGVEHGRRDRNAGHPHRHHHSGQTPPQPQVQPSLRPQSPLQHQPPPPPHFPPPPVSHMQELDISDLETQDPKIDGRRDWATPIGTPTQGRRGRRRSNLFTPKGKDDDQRSDGERVGSGRVIPVKQGYLYKRSNGLNKEWKKKYCALTDDGRMAYHPSLHDYMDDVHIKEISLMHTTVKIPGMCPRGSRLPSSMTSTTDSAVNSSTASVGLSHAGLAGDKSMSMTQNCFSYSSQPGPPLPRPTPVTPAVPKLGVNSAGKDTPSVKRRHRRARSGGAKNVDGAGDDSDGYEFFIVSLDNKQWHFEASSSYERDEWVECIERQILTSLQANDISGKNNKCLCAADDACIQSIRTTRGNTVCADCGASGPCWTSINLGAVVCIECCSIHRNLGTHVSRVRSLDLDDWPAEVTKVMLSIGNCIANSVWEADTKGRQKPTSVSCRMEKESWIKAKYDSKDFLPPLPYFDIPVHQQLIDALVREDIRNIIVILGHAVEEDVNAPYSKDDGRTPLHIAAALGNVVYLQLLLWSSADVHMVDHEGRNALWYARSSGSTECAQLLCSASCHDITVTCRHAGSHHQSANKEDMFEKLPASVI